MRQFNRTTSHHATKGVQISSNSSTFCWMANWLSQLLISTLLGIMDIYIIGNRFWNGFSTFVSCYLLSKQNIWVQVPCHGDISRFGCAYGFHSIWWLDLLFEFGHLDFIATENTTSPLKGILFGPIFRENQVGECSKKTQLCGVKVPSNSSVGTRAGGEIESQPFAADDVPRHMWKPLVGLRFVAQECQLSTDLKRQMSRSTRWCPWTWCSFFLYGIVTVALTFHCSSMMGPFNITLHLFENDVLFFASAKLEAG